MSESNKFACVFNASKFVKSVKSVFFSFHKLCRFNELPTQIMRAREHTSFMEIGFHGLHGLDGPALQWPARHLSLSTARNCSRKLKLVLTYATWFLPFSFHRPSSVLGLRTET